MKDEALIPVVEIKKVLEKKSRKLQKILEMHWKMPQRM